MAALSRGKPMRYAAGPKSPTTPASPEPRRRPGSGAVRIRAGLPWLPLPTLALPVWLAAMGLILALLFLLTPGIRRGQAWSRGAARRTKEEPGGDGMRSGHLCVLILLLMGLVPPNAAADQLGALRPTRTDPCGVRVESRAELDCAAFNAEIEAAAAAKESWPMEPLQVALRRLGVADEMPGTLDLRVEGGGGEAPSSLFVTTAMEGLADDSVAGVWASLELRRLPDGTWRLAREARAWKCARGARAGKFQSRRCP